MKTRIPKLTTNNQHLPFLALATKGLATVFFLLSGPALAYGFAGGTGEPNDPYQIATAEHLVSIGSDPNLLRSDFVLLNDIDLDPNLPGGRIFGRAVIAPNLNPAGSLQGTAFGGSFDGKGHSIANLMIHADGSYIGLFGVISEEGTIQNTVLTNIQIQGQSSLDWGGTGGLAGYSQGTIKSCSGQGRVTGLDPVGGLVGTNDGSILSCTVDGTVVGQNNSGGMIGFNLGTVRNCSSTADVTGQDNVGGLIGGESTKHDDSIVSQCWANSLVVGQSNVGGLVGSSGGLICFSFAQGIVSGSRSVGGLVGMTHTISYGHVWACCASNMVLGVEDTGGLVGNNARSAISDSYANGQVIGGQWIPGGLVGRNGGRIRRCYALGRLVAYGNGTAEHSYHLYPESSPHIPGISLTPAQMMDPNSFLGWDFYGTDKDGVQDIWYGIAEGFPVLSWQTEMTGLSIVPDLRGTTQQQAQKRLELAGFGLGNVSYDYAYPKNTDSRYYPTERKYTWIDEGDVFLAQPSHVAPTGTPVDLWVSKGNYDWSVNRGNGSEENPFVIETEGQLVSLREIFNSDLWEKHLSLENDLDLAAYSFSQALFWAAFNGHFHGNGHAIHHFNLDSATDDHSGLFSTLGTEAVVESLNLEDALILGSSHNAGILAGSNQGLIIDCTSSGTVMGTGAVGGLVGINSGNVQACHSKVALTLERYNPHYGPAGLIAGLNYADPNTISGCTGTGTINGEALEVLAGRVASHGRGR